MGQKTVKKRQSYGFESSPNIILTIHLQLILEEKGMIPEEEAHVPRKRSREPTVLKKACGQWKRGWYPAQREQNSSDTWEKEQDAEGHSEWGLVKKKKKKQAQAQGTFKACFVLFNNSGIARSIFSTKLPLRRTYAGRSQKTWNEDHTEHYSPQCWERARQRGLLLR